MKTIAIFIVSLVMFTIPVKAQLSDSSKYEAGGSLLYSYSRTVTPLPSNDTFFTSDHQLQFEPLLGYYVAPSLELAFELNYSLTFSQNNTYVYYPDNTYTKAISGYQTHRLGFFLGGSYDIRVQDATVLFFGTKVGISWSRRILSIDGAYPYGSNFDTQWRRAEFSFPCFFGGTKIYLKPNWALVFKAQYIRTNHYLANFDDNNDSVSFGIGVLRTF